jgi:LysM repeat protein
MACEVKVNAITYLKNQEAITDTRSIIDRTKFDELNDKLTQLAISKYGLDTKGDMLFDINISEQIDARTSTYWRDNQVKIYRAIPNESLFEELDQLSRQKENAEAVQKVNKPKPEFFRIDPFDRIAGVPLVDIDISQLGNSRSREIADVLADRLSLAMGVSYQNINAQEATELLKNTAVPYRGEPGFYFAGTVYTVGENVNVNTVLHEFSHPFLQAVRKENKKLFNSLYDQLMATEEGVGIRDFVTQNYPELNQDTELFKEEMLAYALQLKALNKTLEKTETSGFKNFIKKLLAAIKSVVRKVFTTKSKVSKLDVDTTLDEMADMMLNKEFDLSVPEITDNDLAMYARMVNERAQDLQNHANVDTLKKLIEASYNSNASVLRNANNFKSDKATKKILKEALFQKGTTKFLGAIKQSLKDHMDFGEIDNNTEDEKIQQALDAEERRIADINNKSISLINSFDTINTMSKNMLKDLAKISSEPGLNNRHTIGLMMLYKNTSRAWLQLLKDIDAILMDNGQYTDTSNLFYQTLNEITNNITRIQTRVADILKNNNVQFYVEITGYMNEFVVDRLNSNLGVALKNAFPNKQNLEQAILDLSSKVTSQSLTDADIDALVKKGVPEKILKGFLKEYKDNIVDEEKIRGALTGNAHDVSFFNRWLESYSSSNDVLVGPLSIFIQDQKTEVENKVWRKSMKFRKKLSELLPKVNFSKLNVSQVRDMIGEKDTIMFFDQKTGEPVAKEIYKFVSEFGNGWRFEQDKLEYDVEMARKEGDLNKLAEAKQKLQEFNNDYMWQEFVPEYYEKDKALLESPVGKLAITLRNEKLAKFNNLQNQFDDELERLEEYPAIKAAWREYQQLFSLQYEDGTDKVDDPEKGIFDKSVAEALIESKKGTQFREMIPVPGSLQLAYNEFVNLLEATGIQKGSGEFIRKMDEWKKQNLKIKYTDEYWKSRNEIFDEIQQIQSKIKNRTFDVAEAHKKISNMMFSFKDEFNQPISNEMGEERLRMIKDLQQEIIDYEAQFDNRNGLTLEQSNELYELSKEANKGLLAPGSAKLERYIYLSNLQTDEGITAEDAFRLKELWKEYGGLSETILTDYYLDALNYALSKQNVKEVQESEARDFINSPEFQELLENDEQLKNWFELNHVERFVWNKTAKQEELRYYPTKANTVSIPTNPDHFERTEIEDLSTGEKIILPGVPSARHSRFEVKNEFRTIPFGEKREDYVGKYVDNKGNWLPRKFGEGEEYSAKDDRFISQRYKQMSMKPGSAEFQLLEAMTEYHLDMQKGQSNYAKLYLDMPRYATKRMDIYQALQRGKYGERFNELRKTGAEWIKQTFGRSVTDYETMDMNYNPENNLVNTDLNGDAVSYIPVTGIYNLDIEATDADVISSMFRYALSIQTQGQLLESLPLVESVLDTLQDPENQLKDLENYSKQIFNVRGILQKAGKKEKSNNRLGQIRSLIEREYYGRQVAGLDENHPMIAKWLQNIQGLSSFGSLALNFPADLKNQFSGYVQTIIESAGADFITTKDIALATPWATKAMLDWTSKGIYSIGPGSMSTQLIQIFDPAFKTTDEFGREVMRSMVKDLTNGEWMFMHRKFGEMDVAVKLFGSFLHGQKVTQQLSDGKEKTLRYVDAWETDADGIIKLKEGIHPGWNNVPVYHTYSEGQTLEEIAKQYYITPEELKAKNRIKSEIQLEDGQEIVIAKSEKFKGFKNKLQGTSRRLFGVYDDMGQPEGNKLILYRLFFFMRKWFTPMFVNRFGFDPKTIEATRGGERYDWALGKYTKGYYITAFQVMAKLISSKGADYQYLTDQEKGDFRRFASEGLATIMLALLASMLLGYDPDDEDRWKKLKRKSGAINQESFNTYGFLSNHMLLLILGVQAETTAFIPLPRVAGQNFGLDDYTKMITSTSSAWYNTTTLYAQIMRDILSFLTFNGLPEYKKDIGPYWWQQKGEAKIWKSVFKAFGFTGGTGDPVTVLKNLEGSSTRFS